ncbi:unnamed protein product [Gongylonema pulchrum]|uniref:RPAP1_N domain-containing protein n=1 Tax=Gongylonema pulchrum TaxID=637853 RepID=A0A183D010_9BILA|nr:unnamed protein product [Gongylonema pulchrum]
MSNEERAAAMKALPGEHPTHNYFFARSSEQVSAEDSNALGNLPVFRSIIEIKVPRDMSKLHVEDQKALAGVLETCRIGRSESLFKKKGEAFGRKIAEIPIATPMKRPEQQQQQQVVPEREKSVVAVGDPGASEKTRLNEVGSTSELDGAASFNGNDSGMEVDSNTDEGRPVVDDVRLVSSKQVR